MADFIQMKYENPKLKQSELAKQLGYSSSTLHRYRNDINMLYHTEVNQITPINEQKMFQLQTLITIHIVIMTSNDLVKHNTKSIKKNKIILKDGSIHEDIEINDQYLDEILDYNDI